MKVAICDAVEKDRTMLHAYVVRYFCNTSVRFECRLYEKAEDLCVDISNGMNYDVVILDSFQTNKILGSRLLKKLREIDFKGKLLFCAPSVEYITDKHGVFVSGYLIKPISYKKLKLFFDRFVSEYENARYVISQRANQVYIPINDIMYFESVNTKCHIHCTNEKQYTIYKQLRQVETELMDERFLRCHRSFLVNMNHIKEAKDVFVLTDGTEVLIKQKERRAMHARVRAYFDQREVLIGTSDYEY